MTDVLTPDTVLNGRYRIQGLVGSGGMGAVYKAIDTGLGGRIVAVKEMSDKDLSPQEITEAAEAFQQEAHLLANLHHPHLPGIHDHFTDGGRWYLVMDFIEGETLRKFLLQRGAPGLPVEEVLRLADQLCDVLTYLHTHNPPIIYRDLKPSNIMVTSSGHLYLIDFGIARLFKPSQTCDTVTAGTAGYAAPEQLGTAQTTVQSDIFSFGVTLHELLTGLHPTDKPFTFAPILPLNPQTPPRLEALIMWMVQLDESRRPVDIVVIRHELDLIAYQLSMPQPTTPVQLSPAVYSLPLYVVPPTTMPAAYPSSPITHDRTLTMNLWIFGSIGALVAICGVVAVICSMAVNALGQSPAQGTLSANQSVWSSDENTLSSDVSTLSSDVTRLAQASDFSSTLAAYATDWKQMQKDYQQEQRDYQQGCNSYGTVQSDAGSVASDLASIKSDDGSLTSDQDSFNPELQQVQSDMATVQTDLQILENDAAGSSGDATVTSSESNAQAALASAQQQVTTSNQALQSAQSQVQQYDQEAAQTNTNAQNLANSMHC
jgi:serine/threonine protein kinase